MAANNETKENVSVEYKRIRQRCIDTCNTIVNLNLELCCANQENETNKPISYVDGLLTEIKNSNTIIVSDKNYLTSLYLSEMKQKTEHLDELMALTKSSLNDSDYEIERLETLIISAKEALLKPQVIHKDVTPEILNKAKETFREMKHELLGLVQSLFPDFCSQITQILGELMNMRLNEESDGYIDITNENYAIIEILRDISIVTNNPYNSNQVKLAY